MLDLAKVLPAIEEMLSEHERGDLSLAGALALAVSTISAASAEELAEKVDAVSTSWLLARPMEPTLNAQPLPDSPGSYVVVAADGSQIPADRNEAIHCFLLNTGTALIQYGEGARAELRSNPTLHFREEETTVDIDGESRSLSSRQIQARRFMAECDALESLLENAAETGLPALAFADGTLILWPLEAAEKKERDVSVGRLNRLLDSARSRRIPVAGYVSRPGSRDVVNTLRASLCGFEKAQCRLKCPSRSELRQNSPCGPLDDLTDAVLFGHTLNRGERTPVFGSRSKVLEEYSIHNQTVFFYLNVGVETARIEIPRWVAEDDELLNRVHALAFDQAMKGAGYPRALTESHECAIVRGPERSAFFQLVETAMIRRGIPVSITRKALAKRTRTV